MASSRENLSQGSPNPTENIENLFYPSLDMIFFLERKTWRQNQGFRDEVQLLYAYFSERKTYVLIKLRRCVVWYVPLLFACSKNCVSLDQAHVFGKLFKHS